MNSHSPLSDVRGPGGRLTLRGFRDAGDFGVIAQIHKQAVWQREGAGGTALNASRVEGLVSAPERLQIAEIDQVSTGFIFVAREGTAQLDEFGTMEGKSWLFIGPTCIPEYRHKGIEKALIDWLIASAGEMGITRLVKFVRAVRAHEYANLVLAEAGFQERLRYYHMQLKMTSAPPAPRGLPAELELVDFKGEADFDSLWHVIESAFDYIERDPGSYERTKALFTSMRSAYFPICLERASGKPVGTIALVTEGDRGSIATLGVVPTFQRRGIGSLLLERALDHAYTAGVQTIDLVVRLENPKAIRIYERFGFQVIPERTTIVLLRDE